MKNFITLAQRRMKMKYDLPNGWTCVACGDEYPQDTEGKQVADYSEGTMCKKYEDRDWETTKATKK